MSVLRLVEELFDVELFEFWNDLAMPPEQKTKLPPLRRASAAHT